jgi:methylmalonyl-CoA mutase, N-terminal domain
MTFVMKEETKKFTDSGIEIKKSYDQSDVPQRPPSGDGGPGTFPFTRGIQPDMYRGKLWTMRQYAGFSTAEESNKRYHYLLSQGVHGLSIAFDLPTQIGYDSDHALAEGEVGKVGVAIDSIEDMQVLFNGIKLEEVTTSMTINATAFILLSLYVAVAKQQGADLKKISGTIQNDILKEYAARGTYIFPPNLPCALSLIFLNGAVMSCRHGILFLFPVITSAKQEVPLCRKWHLHLAMEKLM